MQFTPESIALALFTGVVGALGAYFGAYVKPKAELKAATEDLKQYIANQVALTAAIEGEKLQKAISGAVASESRQCINSLVRSAHSLAHSICWLQWDVAHRQAINREMAQQYNVEAHKAIPELLAQQQILSSLDSTMYHRSKAAIDSLMELDAKVGRLILKSEGNQLQSSKQMSELFEEVQSTGAKLQEAFLGNVRLGLGIVPVSPGSKLIFGPGFFPHLPAGPLDGAQDGLGGS